jgi:hypothetical protein
MSLEAKKLKLSQTMNSSIEKNSSNDPKDAMRMSKTNPLSNSIEVATNVIPKPSEADEYYDEEA